MALVPIRPAGRFGIVQDIPAYELPPEAWSDGLNVRTRDGAIWKVFGYQSVLGTPLAAPYWIMPAFTPTNDFWAYGAIGALYATDGATHAALRTLMGGARDDRWNGGMFGGIGIMNNGVDDPQMWDPPGLGTAAVDLTNWPANTTCKVIRPFGRYLVAYDVTESGARNPQLIKWSSSAPPGVVPASWDETDPSNDAGEWPLTESRGRIVDARTLGPTNFVYKEDETHTMTHIGGRFIFDIKKRFPFGMLAQDCVVEHNRRHYVLTVDDLLVHDGFDNQSLLQAKMKRWFSGRPDPDTASRSYMVKCGGEVWACFPEAGETEPNIAMVVKLSDGTVTIRDIPDLAFMAAAPIDPNATSTTFDSQTIPFDQMVGQFGQRNFSPGRDRCVGARPGTTTFELMDQGFDNDGAGNFRAYVERTGLAVAGVDRSGNAYVDQTAVKLVTQVWPKARLQNGTQLEVYVGGAETPEGSVTWQGPFLWDPSVAPYVDDIDVAAPYLAVRFETNDGTFWKLDEYSLDLTVIGRTAA